LPNRDRFVLSKGHGSMLLYGLLSLTGDGLPGQELKHFRIGPHGAGLANVTFCRNGAVLHELLQSQYVNPCVLLQAQMRGLHHWCDVHPADPAVSGWHHEIAWSVDLDVVERRLWAVLGRYPCLSALPA
jgi:hypothetical protein